ncbi:Ribosomal protein [Parasponia andersonii]|uniref:Ribosomal protein n=1 Tax=Parasponia andersonii TaxID=3476 RepID=A0A2P5AZ47_PARAD|nr:Ribosomal protein [Parasponia andersonii]
MKMMMQRLSSKLRSLAVNSAQTLPYISSSRRLLHSSPKLLRPLHSRCFNPLFSASSSSMGVNSTLSSQFLLSVRHVSSRERRKRRKPMTPVTSKLKKIKMKSFSSYKSRFRTMNDGNIRRWKEGKRHNAHLKSKKAKRRLRRPAIVPLAYAKRSRCPCISVMIKESRKESPVERNRAYGIAARKSNTPLNLVCGDYAQYRVACIVHESLLFVETPMVPSWFPSARPYKHFLYASR